MFDAHNSTWAAYGRAVFVEADDEGAARCKALEQARADYGGMEITIYALGESTRQAWDGFLDLKRRQRRWMEMARQGRAYREIFTEG